MSAVNPSTFTILTYRAFEPTEISGLKAWYDATTINQADGTSVTAWLDQSGNEAHMYQSTTAAQPTLQTNELNGRPVVRFDGTDDFMNLTAPFDVIPTSYSSVNANCSSNNGIYFVHGNSANNPKITIYKKNGNNFNKLADPSTLPAGTVFSSNFSNDDNYLAVANSVSPFITIYKRTGDTFTKLANPASLPAGTSYSVNWSSDDNYLIVGHAGSPYITIYSVDKTTDTLTKLSNPLSLPLGPVWSAEFSTNSSYLAVGETSGSTKFLEIYSNNAGILTKLTDPTTLPTVEVYSISWLDDQTFAIGFGGGTSQIWIYKYDSGTSTFQRLTTFSTGLANHYAIKYSRNKNYLAVCGNVSPYFKIYSINGTTYTALSNPISLPIGSGRGVSWGLNDSSIIVSHENSPFIQAYTFDGTTLTNLTKLNMFRNVGGGTIFVVKKVPNNATQLYYFFVGNNAESPRLALLNDNTFKYVTGGRRLDSNTVQIITSTASTNFDIVSSKYDYLNSDLFLYVNGATVATSTSFQTDGTTSNTDSTSIKIGARGSTADYMNGDIAEVIVYNRALTTQEIKNVHYYLATKYNISVPL